MTNMMYFNHQINPPQNVMNASEIHLLCAAVLYFCRSYITGKFHILLTSNFTSWPKIIIIKKNSNGPSTEPWGTFLQRISFYCSLSTSLPKDFPGMLRHMTQQNRTWESSKPTIHPSKFKILEPKWIAT